MAAKAPRIKFKPRKPVRRNAALQIFPQGTLSVSGHRVYHPICACIEPTRTTPAPDPHQSALRRMCHLYSAALPPQCLVELQFRDRLCIGTHIVQQPIIPGFRCQAIRLLKLQFRD